MDGPNHTPAPWGRNIKPARKYNTIFAGRNTHVCYLVTDRSLTDAELEANADLIAAAPDLLHACERALFVLESPALDQHMVNGAGVLAVLRKAIGQARGA